MEKIREEIFEYKREAGYFRELAECFGQRGVQAMLIEQVMPEVEGYANELLGLVSDGRMQVQFVTQRARRGSSSEEPIETLDIVVTDEGDNRPVRAVQRRGGVSGRLRDPDRDQQATDAPCGHEVAVPGHRRGVRLAGRGRSSAL